MNRGLVSFVGTCLTLIYHVVLHLRLNVELYMFLYKYPYVFVTWIIEKYMVHLNHDLYDVPLLLNKKKIFPALKVNSSIRVHTYMLERL